MSRPRWQYYTPIGIPHLKTTVVNVPPGEAIAGNAAPEGSVIPSARFFRGGFPLHLERLTDGRIGAPHAHEFLEWVVFEEGECLHEIGGVRHPVGAGDVFIVQAGERHRWIIGKPVRLVNVYFEPAALGAWWPEFCRLPHFRDFFFLEPLFGRESGVGKGFRLGRAPLARLLRELRGLEDLLGERPEGYRLEAASILMGLLVRLLRQYGAALEDRRRAARGKVRRDLLDRAIAHAREHFAEKISQKELADSIALDPAQFCRLFKKRTGRSFVDFLHHYRIARACEALRAGDRDILAIAGDCGFASLGFFNKVFRRQLGLTPGEYRAKLRPRRAPSTAVSVGARPRPAGGSAGPRSGRRR